VTPAAAFATPEPVEASEEKRRLSLSAMQTRSAMEIAAALMIMTVLVGVLFQFDRQTW
jgi:hypothetical protein